MSKLIELQSYFKSLLSLPWTEGSIPGSLVENVVALSYGGTVLDTYDFVDVINQNSKIGWQVKSTKEDTPVTWKRAKIPGKEKLISDSLDNENSRQNLGNALIDFCNTHAQESLEKYDLDEIRYARCILMKEGAVRFFERPLCTSSRQNIFNKDDFYWRWSDPKKTTGKEQLNAFHGFSVTDDSKMWAWHGRGENQLHFSGEKTWWTSGHITSFHINQPTKLSWADFFIKLNS